MKRNLEESNPCQKEQELTYKCFNANNFDKDACELEMRNYKVCRSFWHAVTTERRRKGLLPYLPPVAERERIKQEYFSKVKNPG